MFGTARGAPFKGDYAAQPRHLFLWGKWNGKVHIARGAGCALRL